MERAQAFLALRAHLFLGSAHGPVIAELARIFRRCRRQKADRNGFLYVPEHSLDLVFALTGKEYRNGLVAALDCREIQGTCVDRRAKDAFHGGPIEQGLEQRTALYPRRVLVVIVVAVG